MKRFKNILFVVVLLLFFAVVWKYGGNINLFELVKNVRATIEGSVCAIAEIIKPIVSLAVK